MMKPFTLLVVLSTTVMLAGCELYFGKSNDHWDYCGSDGYHSCEGDNCTWVSPTCPTGSGSGSAVPPGGYECTANTDCAAGCYCSNGVCEEAGFCTQDSDCGTGYVCNVDRSSCEPAPQAECAADADCAAGSVCTNGSCTATCACTTDAEAASQGYSYCDESRGTCMSGSDPAGVCPGEPTCNQVAPACPSGQVPTLANGCWTGQCEAVAACATPPSCKWINDEPNCLGRTDCSAVYLGINCQKPDGSACQTGDTNCTCESFSFSSCKARTAASTFQVKDQFGHMIDASQLLLN